MTMERLQTAGMLACLATAATVAFADDLGSEAKNQARHSILLAGHHACGVALLKLLIQDESNVDRGLRNAGLWMVEQKEDGTYQLKIYNGEVYSEQSSNSLSAYPKARNSNFIAID